MPSDDVPLLDIAQSACRYMFLLCILLYSPSFYLHTFPLPRAGDFLCFPLIVLGGRLIEFSSPGKHETAGNRVIIE